MKTIRWGMIGCGAVTEAKSAPAYSKAVGSKLVAVSSRRPSSARDYAASHGIEHVFDTPDQLIRSPEVDAVYIATPPSSHLELALQVAAAGKPCCVEKPFAKTYAEAVNMLNGFEAAGQPLFVSYYRRSLPRFQQVRRWLAEGAIGEVRHVHWTLTRQPTAADLFVDTGWRTKKEEAPGGYFDDLACHGLDLFDFLMGPIVRASGFSRNQGGLYQVPDAVAASWCHQSGATGSGAWNFASSAASDEVLLAGSKGQVRFSVFQEVPVRLESASGTTSVEIPNPDPIQLHHVAAMIRQLSGQELHPARAQSAVRTARVMDEILASA